MNALDLLKEDHDRVDKLFQKVEATEEGEHMELFEQIHSELEVHTHIEPRKGKKVTESTLSKCSILNPYFPAAENWTLGIEHCSDSDRSCTYTLRFYI